MLQSQETYRSSTRRHVIGYNIDELMAQWKHFIHLPGFLRILRQFL